MNDTRNPIRHVTLLGSFASDWPQKFQVPAPAQFRALLETLPDGNSRTLRIEGTVKWVRPVPMSSKLGFHVDHYDDGHLIALSLGGPDVEENLVKMWFQTNRFGAFRQVERQIYYTLGVDSGSMSVDVFYPDESSRIPDKLKVEIVSMGSRTALLVQGQDRNQRSAARGNRITAVVSNASYCRMEERDPAYWRRRILYAIKGSSVDTRENKALLSACNVPDPLRLLYAALENKGSTERMVAMADFRRMFDAIDGVIPSNGRAATLERSEEESKAIWKLRPSGGSRAKVLEKLQTTRQETSD